MNTDKHRYQKVGKSRSRPSYFLFLSVFICVHLWIILLSSCSTKPSDLRTLVPAETLVYLETNDLAAALQPIVDSKPFSDVVTKKPDFSALKGVQVAIAVTGFETSEVAVTDEQAIGKVQPHFVAIADTHAWQFQTVRFAEQKLGSFVAEIYGSEPTLEKSEKGGGHKLVWTAQDGRKAFAVVSRSLIYFGNDESAIEKCLAVKRGEIDSIATTGKLPPHVPGNLASGYVSTDGVAQIATLAGLHFASQASDEEEVQSAVAGILPQLIRGTVTDITWSTSQTSEGIEDIWSVTMPADVASVFNETVVVADESVPASFQNNTIIAQLPANTASATRYNLKSPHMAWRSVLLVAQSRLSSIEARIISEFGGLLFEPYGIRDPDLFLSSFGGKYQGSLNIVTAKLDAQSEDSVLVAPRGDLQLAVKALSPGFKAPNPIIEGGLNVWSSSDLDLQVAFDGFHITIASREDLSKINGMRLGDLTDIRSESLRQLAVSKAPITSVGRDMTSTLALIDILAREGHGDTQVVSTYLTETRFTKTGMERRTVSDFGFIGWMIAQLAAE